MTLKAGHNNVPDYPHGQIIQHFADLVSKKTNGEVKVDVFANATLGDEEELIEGMRAGSVDMGKSITSIVALTVPQFAVFDLPYLFRRDDVGNTRHAARLTDGCRAPKCACARAARLGRKPPLRPGASRRR